MVFKVRHHEKWLAPRKTGLCYECGLKSEVSMPTLGPLVNDVVRIILMVVEMLAKTLMNLDRIFLMAPLPLYVSFYFGIQ